MASSESVSTQKVSQASSTSSSNATGNGSNTSPDTSKLTAKPVPTPFPEPFPPPRPDPQAETSSSSSCRTSAVSSSSSAIGNGTSKLKNNLLDPLTGKPKKVRAHSPAKLAFTPTNGLLTTSHTIEPIDSPDLCIGCAWQYDTLVQGRSVRRKHPEEKMYLACGHHLGHECLVKRVMKAKGTGNSAMCPHGGCRKPLARPCGHLYLMRNIWPENDWSSEFWGEWREFNLCPTCGANEDKKAKFKVFGTIDVFCQEYKRDDFRRMSERKLGEVILDLIKKTAKEANFVLEDMAIARFKIRLSEVDNKNFLFDREGQLPYCLDPDGEDVIKIIFDGESDDSDWTGARGGPVPKA